MILAVTGCAGGVGRSTLAYELAAATNAVAVDADLGMADLPGGRGPDLHDVLAGRAAPHEALRDDGRVARLPCGRTLAGTRAADASRPDPDRLGAAVRRAVPDRDAVVDCPARSPGPALAVADAALVVTTPRRRTPAAVCRSLRCADRHDASVAGVVRNRVRPDDPSESLGDRLDLPVRDVPADDDLARSLVDSVPALARTPDGPAAAAIRDLASLVAPSCGRR